MIGGQSKRFTHLRSGQFSKKHFTAGQKRPCRRALNPITDVISPMSALQVQNLSSRVVYLVVVACLQKTTYNLELNILKND